LENSAFSVYPVNFCESVEHELEVKGILDQHPRHEHRVSVGSVSVADISLDAGSQSPVTPYLDDLDEPRKVQLGELRQLMNIRD
jgi:hypothetical protein